MRIVVLLRRFEKSHPALGAPSRAFRAIPYNRSANVPSGKRTPNALPRPSNLHISRSAATERVAGTPQIIGLRSPWVNSRPPRRIRLEAGPVSQNMECRPARLLFLEDSLAANSRKSSRKLKRILATKLLHLHNVTPRSLCDRIVVATRLDRLLRPKMAQTFSLRVCFLDRKSFRRPVTGHFLYE
jgi:hypothetical protein